MQRARASVGAAAKATCLSRQQLPVEFCRRLEWPSKRTVTMPIGAGRGGEQVTSAYSTTVPRTRAGRRDRAQNPGQDQCDGSKKRASHCATPGRNHLDLWTMVLAA